MSQLHCVLWIAVIWEGGVQELKWGDKSEDMAIFQASGLNNYSRTEDKDKETIRIILSGK